MSITISISTIVNTSAVLSLPCLIVPPHYDQMLTCRSIPNASDKLVARRTDPQVQIEACLARRLRINQSRASGKLCRLYFT